MGLLKSSFRAGAHIGRIERDERAINVQKQRLDCHMVLRLSYVSPWWAAES